MIPEDDRAPAWLPDRSTIAADLGRMEQFAASLIDDLEKNYIPYLARINDDVTVELPPVNLAFRELYSFLMTHRDAQQNTNDLVHFLRDATGGFAVAADEVSKHYGQVDAFTAAKVGVVEAELDKTMAARPADPVVAAPPTVRPPVSSPPASPEAW